MCLQKMRVSHVLGVLLLCFMSFLFGFPMDAIVKKDTIKDTVYINIPIQRKTYQTDDYRAVISGYRPNLDTMTIYHKREIIYEKSRRWGLGITAGYGLSKDGFSPCLSMGVFYRIW